MYSQTTDSDFSDFVKSYKPFFTNNFISTKKTVKVDLVRTKTFESFDNIVSVLPTTIPLSAIWHDKNFKPRILLPNERIKGYGFAHFVDQTSDTNIVFGRSTSPNNLWLDNNHKLADLKNADYVVWGFENDNYSGIIVLRTKQDNIELKSVFDITRINNTTMKQFVAASLEKVLPFVELYAYVDKKTYTPFMAKTMIIFHK